jgi:uncharacterized protein (TIGR03435 family)
MNRNARRSPRRWRFLFMGALAIVAGSVAGSITAGAESQLTNDLNAAFEVASVKANKNGPGPFRIGFQGATFTATNITVRQLMAMAFAVERFLPADQLVGGPSWIDSDRFDVVAKAIPAAGPADNRPMLQALLKGRFGLVVHKTSRTLPIYAIVLARKDGRLGPQLIRTSVDCAALRAGRGNRPPLPPEARPRCGFGFAPGWIVGGSVTLSEFAAALIERVNRTVVNRTGITERFNLKLQWTPEHMPELIPGGPPPGAPPLPDPNGPSIFAALREQLGLKLESSSGPVQVVVVDSVHEPTPD